MILSGIGENTQNKLFKLNKFKHDVMVVAPSTTVVQCTAESFARISSCQKKRRKLTIITKNYINHSANVKKTMTDDNNYTGDGMDYLTRLEDQFHELRNEVR